MERRDVVVITDGDGWSKSVPILKSLFYVGSHGSSEVLIEPDRGEGIAPRHLQLIALPGDGGGYRIANLSDAPVVVSSLPSPLGPRAVGTVRDGDSVRLGSFTLEFRLTGTPGSGPPQPGPATERPPAQSQTAAAEGGDIGIELRLERRELAPDRPIEGAVTLRNLGDRPGVQFRIEVQGLPADCCELEPSPILFPGAEREIALRLTHSRAPRPQAGQHTLSIRASAPDAYPGQSAIASQVVEVLPHYDHELRFTPA